MVHSGATKAATALRQFVGPQKIAVLRLFDLPAPKRSLVTCLGRRQYGNMAIYTFVSAKAILTENDEANGSQFAVKG